MSIVAGENEYLTIDRYTDQWVQKKLGLSYQELFKVVSVKLDQIVSGWMAQVDKPIIATDEDVYEFFSNKEYWLNLRLQIKGGQWTLWSGDSSFDADHGGNWGGVSVNCLFTSEDIMAAAKAMIVDCCNSDFWH